MRRAFRVTVLLSAAVLAACATGTNHVYKLYPGPERPAAELATLVFDDRVYHATIDGLYVERWDYGSVQVLPGTHTIAYGAAFAVSYLVNPEMQDSIEGVETFELLAGKTYLMKSDRSYGHGYTMYLWIEEAPPEGAK